MSAAGGLAKAVERAVGVGCRALQVFTKNSNQWAGQGARPRGFGRVPRGREGRGDCAPRRRTPPISSTSPPPTSRRATARSPPSSTRCDRCDAAGIPFLVLHPGSHGGDGEETGLDRIARGLDEAAKKTPGSKTTILLETAAGQGACLGHTFAQLAAIRGASPRRRGSPSASTPATSTRRVTTSSPGTAGARRSTRPTERSACSGSRSSTRTTRRRGGAAASTGTSGSASERSARPAS